MLAIQPVFFFSELEAVAEIKEKGDIEGKFYLSDLSGRGRGVTELGGLEKLPKGGLFFP